MLGRSKENCKAALFLLGKRYYDGSVVAFYYSVLHRMMYALNEHKNHPLPYERQNPLNENIHLKILTELGNRFSNHKEEQAFREQFLKLFDFRKKADYQGASITLDECLECRSLSEGLISKLNRYFPVRNS